MRPLLWNLSLLCFASFSFHYQILLESELPKCWSTSLFYTDLKLHIALYGANPILQSYAFYRSKWLWFRLKCTEILIMSKVVTDQVRTWKGNSSGQKGQSYLMQVNQIHNKYLMFFLVEEHHSCIRTLSLEALHKKQSHMTSYISNV